MEKDFISISELSKKLDLINKKSGKPANHTLRFWEKEFNGIKPIKLKGNRRYYGKNQVDKIKYIKYLLKDKGLTIKGVKKILKEQNNIDVGAKDNIRNDYLKKSVKLKTKSILDKIKKIKKYG